MLSLSLSLFLFRRPIFLLLSSFVYPLVESCRLFCRVYFWLSLLFVPRLSGLVALGRLYFWLNLRSLIRFGLYTILRRLYLLCAFVVHVDGLSFVLLAFGEVKCRLLLT